MRNFITKLVRIIGICKDSVFFQDSCIKVIKKMQINLLCARLIRIFVRIAGRSGRPCRFPPYSFAYEKTHFVSVRLYFCQRMPERSPVGGAFRFACTGSRFHHPTGYVREESGSLGYLLGIRNRVNAGERIAARRFFPIGRSFGNVVHPARLS